MSNLKHNPILPDFDQDDLIALFDNKGFRIWVNPFYCENFGKFSQ